MCGRIARIHPIQDYIDHFGLSCGAGVVATPRYNVAPGSAVEGVVKTDEGLRLGPMRWGFRPPFEAKHKPFNARAETVATSPMFADALRHRRCWVIADGFYEWQRQGKAKTPHFIRLRAQLPMTLAGIWSFDHDSAGTKVATCAVITCPPNELMAPIHNRMPVILPAQARYRWLEQDVDVAELRGLLAALPAEELEAWKVSSLVSSVANDSPECVERTL